MCLSASPNLVCIPPKVLHLHLPTLYLALHGDYRVILCTHRATCQRCCDGRILDIIMGVQVSAHVRIRIKSRDRRCEYRRTLFVLYGA